MLHHGANRIVFSSSAAVYGETQSTPIRETDPLQPTNVYGESKLLGERMLDWFHRIHGVRYASLGYFNAAGATSDHGEAHRPETHLIPFLIQAALGTRDSVSIFGVDDPTRDGTCIRDYIHVSDLAKAHILALEALNTRSQMIYNLGNGQGFSVREVIAVAQRVSGRQIETLEAARRVGDPAILVASSKTIQHELGWRPQYPELEVIVETAWDWHRRHWNGYSS